MNKHGKSSLLDFTDNEINKLRNCFNQMDETQSGSIGLEDLEEPLIGLGLAETVAEI